VAFRACLPCLDSVVFVVFLLCLLIACSLSVSLSSLSLISLLSRSLLQERVLCACAPGFYGVDYCEPIPENLRLPAVVTLYSYQNNIAGGRPTVPRLSPSLSNTEVFLQFVDPPVNLTTTIFAAPTIFSLLDHEVDDGLFATSYGLRPDPTSVTIRVPVLSRMESQSVIVPLNQDISPDMRYTSNITVPGLELQENVQGFTVSGRFERSGVRKFSVHGTDLGTNETLLVAEVTLIVVDCGPSVCQNNGTCVDDADPYNSMCVRACVCVCVCVCVCGVVW
jgi:hypothetical protein